MEIQVFQNENSSQTNAYSHYSNVIILILNWFQTSVPLLDQKSSKSISLILQGNFRVYNYVMLLSCLFVCFFVVVVLLDWICLSGSDYNIYKKENAEGKTKKSAHAVIKVDQYTVV